MARPRKAGARRRYHVTLSEDVADRLAAYAATAQRSVSNAAGQLITDALTGARENDAELRAARHQVEELTAHVDALHRQLTARADARESEQLAPRWEWPMEALLADVEWWDRWLPRLHELLGRSLAAVSPGTRDPARAHRSLSDDTFVDERGYSDVLAFLFPAIVRQDRTVTWRSAEYPDTARGEVRPGGERLTSIRSWAWEPVIRHIAEALSLLDATGQPGVDPYLRIRAEAEITGSWARVLRYLVGEDEPPLPQRRLG